jgi:hypothetical protein
MKAATSSSDTMIEEVPISPSVERIFEAFSDPSKALTLNRQNSSYDPSNSSPPIRRYSEGQVNQRLNSGPAASLPAAY